MDLRRLLGLRPPPPAADQWEERYRRGYAGNATELPELGHFAVVAAYVRASAPLRPKLVDAGCGRGQLLDQFGEGALGSYDGFDLSDTAVADARARAARLGLDPTRIVVCGFDDWTPREPLDAVVFCESLTYAPRPADTLRRFMSFLAPSGIAVVSLYRNRQAITIGRRLERDFRMLDHSSVVHQSGKRWDVRVFASSGAAADA